MASTTVLALSGPGVPPYSARELQQSWEFIELATADDQQWYTVNGELISTVPEQLVKYKTEITGKDVDPPAIDGVKPGDEIVVDCLFEFCYPITGTPARPVVPGSERTEGDFVFYRPRLTTRFRDFSAERDEYQDIVSWKIRLYEK